MSNFSISFSAIAVAAAQDLFEVTAATAGEVSVHGISLFQTSDHGDAQAEGLQLLWVRGHTTSGSGGAAATPILRSTKTEAASSVCETNNTTIASAGGTTSYWASGWNAQAGIDYWWPPECRPVLRNGERGVLRMSAPGDAITMSGTLYFEER